MEIFNYWFTYPFSGLLSPNNGFYKLVVCMCVFENDLSNRCPGRKRFVQISQSDALFIESIYLFFQVFENFPKNGDYNSL